MSFFLSERYKKPEMASFLGDVKTLKKKVQGFESNTDVWKGHPITCISILPTPATLLVPLTLLAHLL